MAAFPNTPIAVAAITRGVKRTGELSEKPASVHTAARLAAAPALKSSIDGVLMTSGRPTSTSTRQRRRQSLGDANTPPAANRRPLSSTEALSRVFRHRAGGHAAL